MHTHAAIVPLIGGELFGSIMGNSDYVETVYSVPAQLFSNTKFFPKYILSYSVFKNNESHLIDYLRKRNWTGEYILLDESPNFKPSTVDVVSSVCPCAGLSSFSTTSSALNKQNDWLYKTSEYVLKEISPRVLWGENAPRLFSSAGKPVVDKLHEIAKKYNYTLLLYSTKSIFHGVPQRRARTFYFFFQENNKIPRFSSIRRKFIPVETILQIPNNSTDELAEPLKKNPYDHPWIKYALNIAKVHTLKEFSETIDTSTNFLRYIIEHINIDDLIDDKIISNFIDFSENKFYINKLKHISKKLKEGKNFWAHGTVLLKHTSPALIGHLPIEGINPWKDSFLSPRECLNMMCMPEDFILFNPKKNINHICQNVPAYTARDMSIFIKQYLNNELELIPNCSLARFSNVSNEFKIDSSSIEKASLDDFI